MFLSILGTAQNTLAADSLAAQPLSDLQVGEIQQTVDRYHDVFGGLWADPRTQIVTLKIAPSAVGRVRRANAMNEVSLVGTAADKQAASGPKKWHLRLASIGPSLATLDPLMARVTVAQPWARDSSARLVSWYINPKLGKLVIGLDQVTGALVAEARATFGDLVRLEQEQRPVFHNRSYDSQAYYGSDRESAANISCTAGFEVYKQLSPGVFHYGMVTAGHCWGVGTTVYQGYYDNNGTLHSSGTFGSITVRSFGNNVVDAEFLDSTATGTRVADWIWIGSISNPYARNVHSSGTSVFGLQVCFDGSFTGENCQGDVDATNLCVLIEGVTECHLDRAFSLNGSTLAGPGDSGGPIETHDSNSGLVVYGTDTAGDGTSQEYYSDVGYESNALNVGLVTY